MLKHLLDNVLVEDTKKLVLIENKTTAEILKHLEEIDRRKLFADYGYPSMISFCIKELKYSEGAAYRRIQAARLVREIPETLPLIACGKLTLSNTVKAKEFFKAEKIKDSEEKKNIIREIIDKSTREAEFTFLKKASPNSSFRRKNILRQTAANDYDLTVTISASLKEKLQTVKNIKSHSIKNYEELLNFMADLALSNLTKEKTPRKVESKSRCATAALKSILLRQANFQCQYLHPENNKRCQGKAFLQADHITPYASGGKTALGNLRIMCASHNQRRG